MRLTPRIWSWENAPGQGWLATANDVPVVWLAKLAFEPLVRDRLLPLFSKDERLRLERLRVAEDQQRFLIGRGLLRLLIAAHLNVSAENLAFRYGPSGKPSLASATGANQLHFNVSHSGEFVALAFHPAREVGVDIEAVQNLPDWEAIARETFPEAEYRALINLDLRQQIPAFFRAWTRHEARLKAQGTGLGGTGPAAAADPNTTVFDLEIPAGYAGAVVIIQINAS